MNKAELEKEAEEYANNLAFVFETDIVQRIVRERVRLALIDVLEPREKRIEELEDKLSRVKNILLSYIEWEDAVTESKVYVYEDIFVNAIKEIEK